MVSNETQTTPSATTAQTDPLGRLLFVLAVLALACSPTQLMVQLSFLPGLFTELELPHRLVKLANHLAQAPVHPAVLLVLLAALVWAVRWLKTRAPIAWPPLSHWLVVLTVALGMFISGDHLEKSVLKETGQWILALLVGVVVFRTALSTPRRVRTAVIALLITTSLAVLLGVFQRWQLGHQYQPDPTKRVVFETFTPQAYLTAEMPFQICSSFAVWNEHGYHPSRAAYAGFLALVLPFALVLLIAERRRLGMVLWLALLFFGAAISMVAGYLAPALLLGLLLTSFSLGTRWGGWMVTGVVTYLLLLVMFGGFNRVEILMEPFRARISALEATYRYTDGTRHLKKFWGEQQAALNVIRGHPLLGVGAGNYQSTVPKAYDRLGEIDIQRLDPDSQNGYLLMAVNGGLFGLAAMLMLLSGHLGRAWRGVKAKSAVVDSAQATPWVAAALGSVAALTAMMLVTTPWVRGTSVLLMALFAIICNFTETAKAVESDPEQLQAEILNEADRN